MLRPCFFINTPCLSDSLLKLISREDLDRIFKISEGRANFGREFGTVDFSFSKHFFQIFCNLSCFSERGSPKIEREYGTIEFLIGTQPFFTISV